MGHCRWEEDTGQPVQTMQRKRMDDLNLWAVGGQRFETFVETIGKDDGLKDLVCLIVNTVLA